MSLKTATLHTDLQYMNIGPFKVKQPLPNDVVDQVSPFILLHHAGPSYHAPGEIKARLSPHPHRGFEPVTFLFSGKIHHKDSTGSEGLLQGGDVQWMTAGSGIIHSEGPSEEFAKDGGDMELIQLWINLPRQYKMTSPKYQDIKKDSIPVINENGFEIRLVAGEYKGMKGPASTFSPIIAMMMNFTENSSMIVSIPRSFNTMIYVLDGDVESNGVHAQKQNMVVYDRDGDEIKISANAPGKLLFLAGEPIDEPVVSYGPFVMNYPGEIKQAILDYEMGKMGVLEG
jgi:redox-sensitive bicupin YhaK (pirin superfamily)